MDFDKVICNCLNVTNGMIKEAFDNGARTLEEVQERTGAGTVCGVCNDNIQHLLDELAGEA